MNRIYRIMPASVAASHNTVRCMITPQVGKAAIGFDGSRIKHTLLAAAIVSVLSPGAVRNAQADSYSGYTPYSISMDPGDWTEDRSDASTFENVGMYEGRDDVLKIGVTPPADPGGAFYNWQGYKQKTTVPAGNSFLRGDMWVKGGWRNGTDIDFVRTGMWGSAMPENLVAEGEYVDSASVFPIISFTNEGGIGHLEIWDTSTNPGEGWVDLPETAGLIDYDGWNTIDLRLLPDKRQVQYLFNGQVIYTWDMPMPGNPGLGVPEQFFAMYLEARNNGVTGFDTYWSRLLSGLFIQEDTISDTPGDVLIDPDAASSSVVVVKSGAEIGGSVLSEGNGKDGLVVFNGSVNIGGNIMGKNTSFQFSASPDHDTAIGGNLELEDRSSTGGGTTDNPIQIAGNVSVDSTSTLGGNWNIAGDLRVHGSLTPGNSIGVVTVTGNHVFGPSSSYDVEINADGDSDRLDVTGTATLDGTVRVIPLGSSNDFQLGRSYTIITAGAGFGGSMFNGAILDHDSAFLAPSLTYDANNVYVTVNRNGLAFASVAATPNQAAAATGLDSLSFDNAVYEAVALSSADAARQAYDALSGEIHAGTKSGLLYESRYLRETIEDRIREAFDSADREDIRTQEVRPVHGTALSMWAHGFGAWGGQDSDGNAGNLERETRGIVIGVDAPVLKSWRLGIASGYSRSSLDVDARQSSASIDGYYVSAYGGGQFGAVGLRLGAAQGWHGIDTVRTASLPGLLDTAAADYDARSTQAFGEIGYALNVASLDLKPFAGLAYVSYHTDDFIEQGRGIALRSEGGSEDIGYSTLGVRMAKTMTLGGKAILTLHGALGWQHVYGNVSPVAELAFDGGTPFDVEGTPIARNTAVVKTGIAVNIGSNVSVGAA